MRVLPILLLLSFTRASAQSPAATGQTPAAAQSPAATPKKQSPDTIHWSTPIIINDVPEFKDNGNVPAAGPAGHRKHGLYGSQYCRLLFLRDGSWLAGYTVSRNEGYDRSLPYGPASTGGLQLEISKSTDKGKTWNRISNISEPGRDLDNAQLIETKNGDILLACRSVRWQESYILRTYKSSDKGVNWEKYSVFDSTAGAPGTLGHPDKGIYEPHMYYLNDGRLAVQYANEKHVTETPSYSQIISEKISPDEGRTWGPEIWVAFTPGHPDSRPGMPVWTRTKEGNYITVYEICGPEKCNVYYKTSPDGINWPVGPGAMIPDQTGGPFIVSLRDGRLVVTSNKNNISVSDDLGKSWKTLASPYQQMLWGSLYQSKSGKILSVNSAKRTTGGNNIQLATGVITKPQP
ncbi:sialidase family protein [Puia sp. P3]|uniref:sialidase family protein n=1 Tax=Puia sp. P3 TaxID=3423952 RepID=UPI003D66E05A